jgi:hypothetical protein
MEVQAQKPRRDISQMLRTGLYATVASSALLLGCNGYVGSVRSTKDSLVSQTSFDNGKKVITVSEFVSPHNFIHSTGNAGDAKCTTIAMIKSSGLDGDYYSADAIGQLHDEVTKVDKACNDMLTKQ